MTESNTGVNTDRELWREEHPEGDAYSYYSPSIHVTARGGIGINVGGTVFVKSLKEWHDLAMGADHSRRLHMLEHQVAALNQKLSN
jgi:hypothetical protein